jgi:hypothetical protein
MMSGFCSAHKHHEPGCKQCEIGVTMSDGMTDKGGNKPWKNHFTNNYEMPILILKRLCPLGGKINHLSYV